MTPDQDLSARLHACHSCKTECTEIADVSQADHAGPSFQVQCVVCGVRGPIAPTENDASKLWNLTAPDHERAVQAAVAKAVEAADKALRDALTYIDKGHHGMARNIITAAIRSRGVAG